MGEDFIRAKREEEERETLAAAEVARRKAEVERAVFASLTPETLIPKPNGTILTGPDPNYVAPTSKTHRLIPLGQLLKRQGYDNPASVLRGEADSKTTVLPGKDFTNGPRSQFIDKQSETVPLSSDNMKQAIINADKSLEKSVPVMLRAQNDNHGAPETLGANLTKNQGPTAEERAQIMKSIEGLKGTPYPPTEGGLDCSHAVHEAYKNAGLHYEYLTSRAFPGKYFIEISEDELQPGDVVHWPGHVSIYKEGAGQNMVVIGARRPGKPLSETPARYFDDHGSRTYYRLTK